MHDEGKRGEGDDGDEDGGCRNHSPRSRSRRTSLSSSRSWSYREHDVLRASCWPWYVVHRVVVFIGIIGRIDGHYRVFIGIMGRIDGHYRVFIGIIGRIDGHYRVSMIGWLQPSCPTRQLLAVVACVTVGKRTLKWAIQLFPNERRLKWATTAPNE